MPHLDPTIIGLTGGAERIEAERVGLLSQSAQAGLGQVTQSLQQRQFDEFLAGGVQNLDRLADEVGFPQAGRNAFRQIAVDKNSMKDLAFSLMKFAQSKEISVGAQRGIQEIRDLQLEQPKLGDTDEEKEAIKRRNQRQVTNIALGMTPEEFGVAKPQLQLLGGGTGLSVRDRARQTAQASLDAERERRAERFRIKQIETLAKNLELKDFGKIFSTFAQTKEDIDEVFKTINGIENQPFLKKLGITASTIWSLAPNELIGMAKNAGLKKEAEALIDFIATRQRFLADFIKSISGQAAAEPEVVRLSQGVAAARGQSMKDFIRQFNRMVKKITKQMRFNERIASNTNREALFALFGNDKLPSEIVKELEISLKDADRRINLAPVPSTRRQLQQQKLVRDQQLVDDIQQQFPGALQFLEENEGDPEVIREFDEKFGEGTAELLLGL